MTSPAACLRAPDEVVLGREERAFVYSVAKRITRNAQSAEDITQDAMLLAHRYRASFRGESRYRTWLYRIAATTALSHLRRGHRSREQLVRNDDTTSWDVADSGQSPERMLDDAQLASSLRSALEQLPARYRETVLLRIELSEAETARRLGISVANVKIRAHRARQQLRTWLQAIAPDGVAHLQTLADSAAENPIG